MIRPGRMTDMDAVTKVILAAYEEMHFAKRFGCAANPASIARVVEAAITLESADLSVVELHGQVAGACLIEVVPFTWDDQTLLAWEHVWHMHPQWPSAREKREWFMRMFEHMRSWAARKGAKSFTVNVKPGSPAAKYLERRGLSHVENAFTGEL